MLLMRKLTNLTCSKRIPPVEAAELVLKFYEKTNLWVALLCLRLISPIVERNRLEFMPSDSRLQQTRPKTTESTFPKVFGKL
jgi:hypothetical protein